MMKIYYIQREVQKRYCIIKNTKKNFFNYFPFYKKNSKNIINHASAIIMTDKVVYKIFKHFYERKMLEID